jgi:hypothetical protein
VGGGGRGGIHRGSEDFKWIKLAQDKCEQSNIFSGFKQDISWTDD